MARKRTPEEEQHFAYKAGRIMELRRDRVRWSEIAAEFNLSERYCQQIYAEALTAYPAQMADEYRAEELNLADDAVKGLLEIAKGYPETRTKTVKGEIVEYDVYPSFKERIEAWTAIARWSEHKANITGIKAPLQIQFSTDAIQAEIERLTAEMNKMGSVETLELEQGS